MNGVVGTAIAGAGRMWLGATFNLCWAVAMILCSLVLVPKYGGMGLALSYVAAYLLHTVWQMVYTERLLIPSSMKRFTHLYLLTLCTIVPVCILIALDSLNIPLSVLFVIVACIPLMQATRKQYRKAMNDQMNPG